MSKPKEPTKEEMLGRIKTLQKDCRGYGFCSECLEPNCLNEIEAIRRLIEVEPEVRRLELSSLASDILDSFTTSRVVGLIEKFLTERGWRVTDE